MVDDAQLRARIAEQVAARRAERSSDESASSGGAMTADDGSEAPDAEAPPHAGGDGGSRPRPRPGERRPNRPARPARPRPGGSAIARDASRPRPRPAAAPTSSADSTSATAAAPAPAPSLAPKAGSGTDATEPADKATTPADGARGPRQPVVKLLVRLAVIAVIAVVTTLLLRTFVVSPYYIPSGSMEPTLHGCRNCDDDRILVDKISYRFHSPNRGDIVVFHRPKGAPTTDSVLVKRVIGLPGDHLALRGGLVYIDGKRLDESYLDRAFLRRSCGSANATTSDTNRTRWTVPKDDVFVMGDDRCNSLDSRDFGPIRESSIIGRAFMIVWPLGRIRFL